VWVSKEKAELWEGGGVVCTESILD